MAQESGKSSRQLAEAIAECMHDKNGEDVVLIDLTKIANAVCKYFVICNAESNIQVQAVVDHILKNIRKNKKEHVWSKEGLDNKQWILLDYADVVAHVFQTSYREFYNLEGLWADAEIKKIENPVS